MNFLKGFSIMFKDVFSGLWMLIDSEIFGGIVAIFTIIALGILVIVGIAYAVNWCQVRNLRRRS